MRCGRFYPVFHVLGAALAVCALALLPSPVAAQDDAVPEPEDVVAVSTFVSLSGVHPGGTGVLAVVGDIVHGWHVNAHIPSEDFLIPTEVTWKPVDGIVLMETSYDEGVMLAFEFSDTPLSVYDGRFMARVPFQVAPGVAPGTLTVEGNLIYQPCSDTLCLRPASIPFAVQVNVSAPGEAVAPMYPEIFAQVGDAVPSPAAGADEDDRVGGASFLIFALIYLGGLALNLTPCVFPIIPITIAFFGGQVQRSTMGTLGLSTLYVLGMATTYSFLGVITALSGQLFGAALQNPLVLGGVALVMVALALSQFGLYEFRLPGTSGLTSRKGFAGAFFMGLIVGLVAAPCIGPFVVALLATVAREGDPILGFWKFFTLALGLGTPFLFLGAFSGNLARLPRAGMWMEGVKHIFGLVLLVMAAYFLGQAVPDPVAPLLMPIATAAAALWLLLGEKGRGVAWFTGLRLGLAAVGLAVAVWWVWPDTSERVPFKPYSVAAVEAAREEGRPVLLDFTADWCVPCKEYEHLVFNDPDVVRESRRFVTLQADLTRSSSADVQEVIDRFDIFGPPTIVFFDAQGTERDDLRIVGFVNAEEFLARMQAVSATAPTVPADVPGS